MPSIDPHVELCRSFMTEDELFRSLMMASKYCLARMHYMVAETESEKKVWFKAMYDMVGIAIAKGWYCLVNDRHNGKKDNYKIKAFVPKRIFDEARVHIEEDS